MRINAFESILCAGMFTLTVAAFPHPCFAEPEEPFTQKFQNPPPDDGGGPPADGKETGLRQQDGGPQGQHGMGLSEEDRAHMKSIQEKLAKETDVQTAREAVKNAQTKEDRQKAMKSLKEVMDKYLSADDRKFMDKIRKQHSNGSRQGGGQGHGGRQGGGPNGGFGVEGGGPQGRGGQSGESGKPGVDGLFGPGGGRGSDGPPGGRPQRGGPQGGEGESGSEGGRPQGNGPGFGGGFDGGSRPMMTDEQRQRFKSIRDKYKDDPDVKKAREAVKEAVTPEEKELAIEEYRETIQKKISLEDRSFFEELKKNRNRDQPTQAPSPQS